MKLIRVLLVALALCLLAGSQVLSSNPSPLSLSFASSNIPQTETTADAAEPVFRFSPVGDALTAPEYTDWLLARGATVSGTPTTSQQARQSVASWTVMIYMAADNDLEAFAIADLNEMEFVGSTTEVNVVVQLDRSEAYDVSNGDWHDARRYFVTRDTSLTRIGSEFIESVGEINTGEPITLVNFIDWSVQTYPAERYALIIWDHGGSWLGVATDDSANNDDLTLPELNQALISSLSTAGLEQFDVIGFDACLMGAFEVYQTLEPFGRYGIGSAELIPGNGWDYLGLLDALSADPVMDGAGFGRAAVDNFIRFYDEVVTRYDIYNLAVVDLSQISPVIEALQGVYNAINADPLLALDAISAARSQTPLFGAFDDPQFIDFWAAADLIQFMRLLSETAASDDPRLAEASQRVFEASAQMLVYYRSNQTGEQTGGISIYFPRNVNLYSQGDRAQRYTSEAPPGLGLWRAILGTFYNVATAEADATGLEGEVSGVTADESQAVVALGFGRTRVAQASFVVTLQIGNGQSIIVDYDRLGAAEGDSVQTANWLGRVPYLTNGTAQVPVLVLASQRDPNRGIVNGKVYPQNGAPVKAQLVIDLTTNQATSVWGFRETMGTLMPFELQVQPGDIFHPSWLTLGPKNELISVPANVQLPFGFDPLYLVWRRAPAGAYDIVVQVEDAAGNTGQGEIMVLVCEDELCLSEVDPDDEDIDDDGILNDEDNCPAVANPLQTDADDDGIGDACDLFDDLDPDADGVPNVADNCPTTPNPSQADIDGDGIGDACELYSDSDGDGIPDDADNCPAIANSYQIDDDHDGVGDVCDPIVDSDSDGVPDSEDNCRYAPNPSQADSNGNGVGDACEGNTGDADGDGIPDSSDNCRNAANPDQRDSDGDGLGDACDPFTDRDGDGIADHDDNCPTTPNPTQDDSDGNGVGDACEARADRDGDGAPDDFDNCPNTANSDQADGDGDGIGDACDSLTDVDNDGIADSVDNCPNTPNPTQADTDGDGTGDACETATDSDGDGVADAVDNCPTTPNSNQSNLDGDQRGDACDADDDDDGVPDGVDNCQFAPNPDQLDIDQDGIGEVCDSTSNPILGDRVWRDMNANGIQDAGEPSLTNITVELWTSDNVLADSVVTDIDGMYRFVGADPGSYYIRFVRPATFFISPQYRGTGSTDSDANASGRTPTFTANPGLVNLNIDAGMYQKAKLGDLVWNDADASGIRETGEPDLPGVPVALYAEDGTLINSTTSSSTGVYLFTEIIPGRYYVQFTALTDYAFGPQDQGSSDASDSDADVTGRTDVFWLLSKEENYTVDAGLYAVSSVGDRAWIDMNANGIQDSGEPDLSGVGVSLYKNGTTLIGTQTTGAAGDYLFEELAPGSYHVEFTAPATFLFSPQDASADDVDSDADLSGATDAFALPQDTDDMRWDAGLYQNATVGDRLWEDLDGDGVQEPGEPTGQPGAMTIDLFTPGGTWVKDTTPGAGSYQIDEITPGSYYLSFNWPSLPLLRTSPRYQGGSDTGDNDVDPATGRTADFTLVSDEDNPTFDAGWYLAPELTLETPWEDMNANGVKDAADGNVTASTIAIHRASDGGVVWSSSTGDTVALVPGEYYVTYSLPAGFLAFSPSGDDSDVDASGQTTSFTLISRDTLTLSAGMYRPVTFTGLVWNDANGSGLQEAEAGIAGITVRLWQGGSPIHSTGTDGSGAYTFDGAALSLGPGSYFVEVTQPAGQHFTFRDVGSDDAIDSDVNRSNGRTDTVTAVSGQVVDRDAGAYFPASLGNLVWHDLDADGTQDSGEPGLDGVTVRLYDTDDSLIASTSTAGGGLYSFGGLAPITYYLRVVPPPAYEFSDQGQGGDDALDNDVDPATGRTADFTLVQGLDHPDHDAGLFRRATISGSIWEDLDADGLQPGEPVRNPGPIFTEARLYDTDSVLHDTLTLGTSGGYTFANVRPGTYYLEFSYSLASDQRLSPANQGTDNSLDSDLVGTATETVTVISGGSNTTLDVGWYRLARVTLEDPWEDQNGDGFRAGGDGPLAVGPYTITLYDAGNNPVWSGSSGTVTPVEVEPGLYYAVYSLPGVYEFSPQTTDNDADATGRTTDTVLDSGDTLTLSAGAYRPAVFSGTVWDDANADGIQASSGEPGLDGVTVRLLDGSSIPIQTRGTVGGAFTFDGVPPGTYTVQFFPLGSRAFSPQGAGTDPNLDSDANPANGRTASILSVSGDTFDRDAGMYEPSSIGDWVWEDVNLNGLQDDGMTGVGGVTVTLHNDGGTFTDTTTTNPGGYYSFDDLVPDDYTQVFSLPGGAFFTTQNAGDDALDSDANPADGQTAAFTLPQGTTHTTSDAGIVYAVTVSGRVWVDQNGNDLEDGGEPGLSGVPVALFDAGDNLITSTTTGTNGLYSFGGLRPGGYYVVFDLAAGHVFTGPNAGGDEAIDSDADPVTGRTAIFTILSGGSQGDVDAGQYVPATFEARDPFDDLNANGDQETGENPLTSGISITLYDSDGGVIQAGTGAFTISTLKPGSYYVIYAGPAGYLFSPVGPDSRVDAAGRFDFTIASGGSEWAGAGRWLPGQIGNLVWEDTNSNGVREGGEPGLDGVTVTLIQGGPQGTTVTAGGGLYAFNDVVAGTYQVRITLPGGYVFSPALQGGDDTLDSNVTNPATGDTDPFTLIAGDNEDSIDAGVYRPVTISGRVWDDLNANGLDDSEPGLVGVLVSLSDSSGPVATTNTVAGGLYAFANLPSEQYTVTFALQAGYDAFTLPNIGGVAGPHPLYSGQTWADVDAGQYRNVTLTGTVWNDEDADGLQESGEPGSTPGLVDVDLYHVTTGYIATVSADVFSGVYTFPPVMPGDYYVIFHWPAVPNLWVSPPNQGDDALDSDPDRVSGQTASYPVTSGSTLDTIDAGWYLGGAVTLLDPFEDLNTNGVNNSEPVLVGASTITVYDASDDSFVVDSLTGFVALLDVGTYYAVYSLPADHTFGPPGHDSQVDATGRTTDFTVTPLSTDTLGAGVVPIVP